MGFYNRHYMKDGSGSQSQGSALTMGLPKPTPAVKIIMLACVGMYVLQFIMPALGVSLEAVLGVTGKAWWQIWRYISFQFLHDRGSLFHILLNMLGVYFLGTPLEQRFGTKKFTAFYLACGCFAGLSYMAIANAYGMDFTPLIGASGGVYALLIAAAVLFPNFKIIFLFFPVPIRLAAIIIFGMMSFNVLGGFFKPTGFQTPGFWSDVAYLGGSIPAAIWILAMPKLKNARLNFEQKVHDGAWDRKMRKLREEEQQVDQILDKIKEKGIASLTGKEKRILKNATLRQQKEDRRIHKL